MELQSQKKIMANKEVMEISKAVKTLYPHIKISSFDRVKDLNELFNYIVMMRQTRVGFEEWSDDDEMIFNTLKLRFSGLAKRHDELIKVGLASDSLHDKAFENFDAILAKATASFG